MNTFKKFLMSKLILLFLISKANSVNQIYEYTDSNDTINISNDLQSICFDRIDDTIIYTDFESKQCIKGLSKARVFHVYNNLMSCVIKFFSPYQTEENRITEKNSQSLASNLGISPKIIKENKNYFIMEFLHINEFNSNRIENISNLSNVILKLHLSPKNSWPNQETKFDRLLNLYDKLLSMSINFPTIITEKILFVKINIF